MESEKFGLQLHTPNPLQLVDVAPIPHVQATLEIDFLGNNYKKWKGKKKKSIYEHKKSHNILQHIGYTDFL